jgi:hypothetical protein
MLAIVIGWLIHEFQGSVWEFLTSRKLPFVRSDRREHRRRLRLCRRQLRANRLASDTKEQAKMPLVSVRSSIDRRTTAMDRRTACRHSGVRARGF